MREPLWNIDYAVRIRDKIIHEQEARLPLERTASERVLREVQPTEIIDELFKEGVTVDGNSSYGENRSAVSENASD